MNDVRTFDTIRLVFAKTGRARYISHLDLSRAMSRALRRAGIPLWYTEGYNRHPYVTFAAPLSLGYEGLQETMDLRLQEPMPMEELVRRLNAVLPEGLQVLAAAPARDKAGDVAAARYRLGIDCPADTVRALLGQDQVLVEKRTKKKTMKTIDLQPVLQTARADVRPEERGTVVELTLPCGAELSVNPSLVIEALCRFSGRETIEHTVLRLEVYNRDGVLFR